MVVRYKGFGTFLCEPCALNTFDYPKVVLYIDKLL